MIDRDGEATPEVSAEEAFRPGEVRQHIVDANLEILDGETSH